MDGADYRSCEISRTSDGLKGKRSEKGIDKPLPGDKIKITIGATSFTEWNMQVKRQHEPLPTDIKRDNHVMKMQECTCLLYTSDAADE